jgi:hypothetical protein
MSHLQVKFDWHKLRDRKVGDASTNISTASCGTTSSSKSRQNIRIKDPETHQRYLKNDAKRNRLNYCQTRARLTPEQLKERRRQWAKAKKHQRQKPEKLSHKKQPGDKKIKDMDEIEKKQYMAQKKRESRAKMTSQKKSSVQNRESKRQKLSRQDGMELTNTSLEVPTCMDISPPLKSPPSRSTIQRRTAKAKRHLPKSPRAFASVLAGLVEKASPLKKKELENRGIKRKLEDSFVISSLKKSFSELKVNMTEQKRQHYNMLVQECQHVSKYGHRSKIASLLGIGGKMRRKPKPSFQRKRRRDAVVETVAIQIQNFWTSEGISHVVPLKKRVKKGHPLHVLDCNYTQAFQQFRKSFPAIQIGYVKFIEMKPFYVRHMKAIERSVCCCMKCENIKLKLKVLNAQVSTLSTDKDLRISTVHDLSKMTLCSYKELVFPGRECVDRSCDSCGTKKLTDWYAPLENHNGDVQITCDEWKIVKVERLIKKKKTSGTSVEDLQGTPTCHHFIFMQAVVGKVAPGYEALLSSLIQKCMATRTIPPVKDEYAR